MSQPTANGGIKNVVLVHGGFVDGSGWQGVYEALKKDATDRLGSVATLRCDTRAVGSYNRPYLRSRP